MFYLCLTHGALVRDKDRKLFGWCFRTHPRVRQTGNVRKQKVKRMESYYRKGRMILNMIICEINNKTIKYLCRSWSEVVLGMLPLIIFVYWCCTWQQTTCLCQHLLGIWYTLTENNFESGVRAQLQNHYTWYNIWSAKARTVLIDNELKHWFSMQRRWFVTTANACVGSCREWLLLFSTWIAFLVEIEVLAASDLTFYIVSIRIRWVSACTSSYPQKYFSVKSWRSQISSVDISADHASPRDIQIHFQVVARLSVTLFLLENIFYLMVCYFLKFHCLLLTPT